MKKVAGEFKTFLLRGNVVDLAVGVVIGTAFGLVVSGLVADFITPLVGLALPGGLALEERVFTIGTTPAPGQPESWPYAEFKWGHFLNVTVSFLATAFAVFFFVVKPVNKLMSLRKSGPDDESPNKDCPECLSSIPVAAKRCAWCTAELAEGWSKPKAKESADEDSSNHLSSKKEILKSKLRSKL